ncbi:hypothetical protein [uncultured Sphingobacterium sp.]|uniref:hypothetical protein n=1 Tax=uncultured Sphingobacterium sp. TaxID=182688 RepID=UPI0037490132
MNHAKEISANGKTAHSSKPVTTSPPVVRVWELDETPEGFRRNSQGQTAIRSAHDVTNAFLGMQFHARLQEPEIGENYDSSKLEREFFKSLSNISKKLNVTILDCKGLPYPYNISESLAHLKTQLKLSTEDWREIRLVNDGKFTFFAKEDRYNTGCTLYYIPVIPLYTILHNRKTIKASKLLVCVYAYIYQVLAVPYYRNDDCYLNSMYDMLENSYLDDEEEDSNTDEYLTEFKDAELIGDHIKELITEPTNLQSFKKLLHRFKPKNEFEKDVHSIASSFYELSTTYPNVRIDRKYFPLRHREMTEESERPVTLDNYVSFCASIEGNLFHTLCDFVNGDLQEFSEIDEPTRFIPFDNRKIENNDFDFETKVFDNIDRLIQLWQEHNF